MIQVQPAHLHWAVLDVETTGTSSPRIIEIAVVLLDPNNAPRLALDTRLFPGHDARVSPDASALHHLLDAELLGAPTFAEIAGHLMSLLSGRIVVAHNAANERALLTREFERLNVPDASPNAWFCTLEHARTLLPGPHGLADLARSHGLVVPGHTARSDAWTTALLLQKWLVNAAIRAEHVPGAPLSFHPWTAPPPWVELAPREQPSSLLPPDQRAALYAAALHHHLQGQRWEQTRAALERFRAGLSLDQAHLEREHGKALLYGTGVEPELARLGWAPGQSATTTATPSRPTPTTRDNRSTGGALWAFGVMPPRTFGRWTWSAKKGGHFTSAAGDAETLLAELIDRASAG